MSKNKREEMPDILGDILTPSKDVEKKKDIETVKGDIKTESKESAGKEFSNVLMEVSEPADVQVQKKSKQTTTEFNSRRDRNNESRTEKATFYFSKQCLDKLDDLWLEFRKKGLSKTEIVNLAVSHIISDHQSKGDRSIVSRYANK